MDTVWGTALVVSGNHPEKIGRFMRYANIGTVSRSAFQRLSSHVLQPLVKETFEVVLEENHTTVPQTSVVSFVCCLLITVYRARQLLWLSCAHNT